MQKATVDIRPCPRCSKRLAIDDVPQRLDKSRIRVYMQCVKCGWRETVVLSFNNLRVDVFANVKHT